jgi:transposase
LYIGVDLHLVTWDMTVRNEDGEIFSGGIPGKWEALRKLFDRYQNYQSSVVYEAGYFGFWLHDRIVAYGGRVRSDTPELDPTGVRQ